MLITEKSKPLTAAGVRKVVLGQLRDRKRGLNYLVSLFDNYAVADSSREGRPDPAMDAERLRATADRLQKEAQLMLKLAGSLERRADAIEGAIEARS